jgi:hypothetical protein
MKPEFMRLRRAFATAAVVALAATGIAILAPMSASAHDSSLKATSACAPNGTYTVTYTGTTTNVPGSGAGHTANLSVTAHSAGTTSTSDTTVVGNATYFITQSGIPGTAKSASVSAHLAWGDGASANPSGSTTLAGTCAPPTLVTPPTASVSTTACVATAGGNVGDVHVTLAHLVNGTNYTVTLFKNGAAAGTKTISNSATSASFTGQAPGVYHVTVSGGSTGTITSNDSTLGACVAGTPKITVTPSVCVPSGMTGTGDLSVDLTGLTPFTDYTIDVVADGTTTPAVATSSTGTASGAKTYSHTFTGVAPGDYRVIVKGGPSIVTSDAASIGFCPPTLPLDPTLTVTPTQCEQTGDAAGEIDYVADDLNPAVHYHVTLTDSTGSAVTGFPAVTVPFGNTDFVSSFTGVPGGSFVVTVESTDAASSAHTESTPTAIGACDLKTLAFTGPGVFGPLGAVSALLLVLGGAIVLGRLRRRAALQ